MEDLVTRPRRLGRRRAPDPHELVVSTIAEHAESLLRVARRHTDSQADAEDAYQRALEIFVKQAHRLDPATVHRWVHTVVKHEAWAVREQRAKYVPVEDGQVLDALDDGRLVASVEERSERFSELARAAEALRRCKPQEATALVLKAQGLSYKEIAERQGWTYTKVNRCITEGRRAFLARFHGIESGEECERWLPVLSAIADGEATSEQLVDARPHLRNCAGCRAVLAGMHRTGAPVAALLPPALIAGHVATGGGGLLQRVGELVAGAQERVVAPVVKAQTALETAGAGKFAAVAASTVAIAGGGVAVQHHTHGTPDARAAQPPAESTTTTPTAPPTTTPSLPTPRPSGASTPEPHAHAHEKQHPRAGRNAGELAVDGEFAAEADAPAGSSTPQPVIPASDPAPSPRAPEPKRTSDAGDEFDALGG